MTGWRREEMVALLWLVVVVVDILGVVAALVRPPITE